jgi:hypothetical protein
LLELPAAFPSPLCARPTDLRAASLEPDARGFHPKLLKEPNLERASYAIVS